ncbi:hypothetical protein N7537_005649 [Penicillium hordei]|uniref:Uncharacterized protein n=1 Tax=Penicillium hordei TaxID=40994 RepID=A0AAD6H2D0_9EURO|nr:uncharacterized protein N7537_005649 [Penicillium hordei]KAJ5602693.1 hypothetical protein N7537_005649 [Penicillium hordei]
MDLYLREENTPTVDDFECILKLRYNKGSEDSPTDFLLKRIGALPKPEWNLLCVVKLIIIVAFRTGQLDTTLEGLLGAMKRRPDKWVVFRYPQWPLVCSVDHYRPDFDQVAKPQMINHFLKAMGNAAGVTESLTYHDLRRGAARDIAHLPMDRLVVTSENVVAGAIGHSRRAMEQGVTQKHAGARRRDLRGLL